MAGLYIHIPFRQGDCPYDDAYSVVPSPPDHDHLVEAVRREASAYTDHPITETPISTLYIGGGRPSLLSVDALRTLLDVVRTHLDVSNAEEVTLEVSPADLTPSDLNALRQIGVTRLSIEAVSFESDDPFFREAPHTVEQATRTIEKARSAGFQSVSVDLVFAGSSHSASHWKASLERAVELDVPHVTLHELPPRTPSNNEADARADRLAYAMDCLQVHDYEQYELTHFARAGHRSRHQENYYAHGNYLGLGPSAESFWWPAQSENTRARRWSNVADLDAYVSEVRKSAIPVDHRETLDRTTLAREYLLLRLRTSEGVDLDVLDKRYGVNLRASHSALLDRLADERLIHDTPNYVRLTNRGRLLTDAITQRLLPS